MPSFTLPKFDYTCGSRIHNKAAGGAKSASESHADRKDNECP